MTDEMRTSRAWRQVAWGRGRERGGNSRTSRGEDAEGLPSLRGMKGTSLDDQPTLVRVEGTYPLDRRH